MSGIKSQLSAALQVHLKFTGSVLLAIFLASCSGDKGKVSSGAQTETTTATTEADRAEDTNLEFYTDRYLAPDERLKRRQRRIDDVLADR